MTRPGRNFRGATHTRATSAYREGNRKLMTPPLRPSYQPKITIPRHPTRGKKHGKCGPHDAKLNHDEGHQGRVKRSDTAIDGAWISGCSNCGAETTNRSKIFQKKCWKIPLRNTKFLRGKFWTKLSENYPKKIISSQRRFRRVIHVYDEDDYYTSLYIFS